MSMVGQEPVLFRGSIYQNIEYGMTRVDSETLDGAARLALVIKAAKVANTHQFIVDLPNSYDTNVGDRGVLLAGGQKQRIAIARAVVGNPKILLLDEATSALDSESEGIVQAALERAAKGRTTIVVAHRISTICDADNIIVMSHGGIVEQGCHQDLLALNGVYYNLAKSQGVVNLPNQRHMDRMEATSIVEMLDAGVGGSGVVAASAKEATISRQLPSRMGYGSFDDDTKYSLWTLILFVWSLQKDDFWWMLIGFACSLVAGAGMPVQAILYGRTVTLLSLPPDEDADEYGVNFWSLMYLLLALVQLFAFSLQGVVFGYSSEQLIFRATREAFRAILRQEAAFFERDENASSTLSAFIVTEVGRLSGMGGATLAAILNAVTTVIASITIACVFGWKLGLVCTSMMPILVGSGYLRFVILAKFEKYAAKAYGQSAAYVCKAVSAIRTVASLSREEEIIMHYNQLLDIQLKRSLTSTMRSSLLYAASQSLTFLLFDGAIFHLLMAAVFGGQIAGSIFSFAPDVGRAQAAASSLKKLLSRRPINPAVGLAVGEDPDVEFSSGDAISEYRDDELSKKRHTDIAVEFRDVSFTYPSRPDHLVLRNLSFSIQNGQSVAFVGPSGCGKSTILALIESFYQPTQGTLLIGDHDLRTLDVRRHRSRLALVSQEPTLYSRTIRDNIALGAPVHVNIDDAMIEKVCTEANILEYIKSLPDGLQTVVGPKGVMLSGGQKQRICIARALLSNPSLLLLDEATSALDSTSEAAVQESLDQIRATSGERYTTISIAHRISTIQNADVIFVLGEGGIVESGTHVELMVRNGRYAATARLQMSALQST